MFPTPVTAALTAVFLVTGLLGAHALVRGGRARVLGPCGDTRTTELLHLLMSAAMIAMTWGWTGGPDTVGGAVQILVFGGFAAVLGTLGVLGLLGARRDARSARLSHGLMAATMVWMVAAMPLLMSAQAGPDAVSPPAAHQGHGAMSMGATAQASTAAALPSTAGWASAASTMLVALLVVVGLAWVVRAVQFGSPAHHARCDGDPTAVPAPRTAPEAEAARVPVAATGSGSPPSVPAPIPRPAPTSGPEATPARRSAVLAASCHALMGLGTAAMLAAML